MDVDKTTVTIPKVLADKVKERCKGTGFSSVSSYVVYILRQVLSETDSEEKKEAFTENDEKKVKDRLKSLGYLY